MTPKASWYCVLFTLLLANAYAVAQSPLLLETEPSDNFYIEITENVSFFADPENKLTLEDAISSKHKFTPLQGITISSKYYWLRLEVYNKLQHDISLLSFQQGSKINFYEKRDSSRWVLKKSGLLLPASSRDQQMNFGHMPYIVLDVRKGITNEYYWKISNDLLPQISPHTNLAPSIASFGHVIRQERSKLFVFISFCAVLLGLSVYHLILYLLTKDAIYRSASIFSFGAALFMMYFKGYLVELFFPNHPTINYFFAYPVVTLFFMTSTYFFIYRFIDIPRWLPDWARFYRITFYTLAGFCLVASFWQPLINIILLSWILLMLALEVFGILLFYRRHPLRYYYLTAFSLFASGVIVNVLFAWLEITPGVWDPGDIGILGLQFFLAIGLAKKIRLNNDEKEFAQAALINQMQENQLLQESVKKELELKVAERTQEIQEKNQKLTRLNLLKDKLFSIISHDLKSPLNQLSGTLYMLERDMISKEEIKDVVPTIRKNLQSNSSFINELLIWARSQMTEFIIQPVDIDLKEIVTTTYEVLQPNAVSKSITLKNELEDANVAYADLEMVKSILRNLIVNAIKFTPEGGHVKVYATKESNYITIFVKDSGMGIRPDNLEKLFSSQIITTRGTANEKGTGIGLLICKDFVEKNGGSIWVETSSDKGSIFAFTLPKK